MARKLQAHGLNAIALEGGYDAWKAAYPVEPKQQAAVKEGHAAPESAATAEPPLVKPVDQ